MVKVVLDEQPDKPHPNSPRPINFEIGAWSQLSAFLRQTNCLSDFESQSCFAPQDGWTQGSFCGIVGWLNPLSGHKHPQCHSDLQ
jgi:hypothetical protein